MATHSYKLINGIYTKDIHHAKCSPTNPSMLDVLRECELEVVCEFGKNTTYMMLSEESDYDRVQLYTVYDSELTHCAPYNGKANIIKRTKSGKLDFVNLLKVYTEQQRQDIVHLNIAITSREFGYALKFTYGDVCDEPDEMNDFINSYFGQHRFFISLNLTQRLPVKSFYRPTGLVKVYDSHN